MTPKISVIVPIYNMERYLSEALQSVTTQTLAELEIICINDGSTDNSLSILNSWQKKDARVRIIDKQNEGVGRARNDGIAAAIGEYVAFLDPDDCFHDEHVLQTLYDCAKQNRVAAVGGTVFKINAEGQAVTDVKTHADSFGISFERYGAMRYVDWQYDYGFSAFLYSREMLVKQNIVFPALSRFQDPPFFVRALAAADQIYLLDQPVYDYRLWGQVKKMSNAKLCDMIDGLHENLLFAYENNLDKLYYLTMLRLQKEVSYRIISRLDTEEILPVLLYYFAIYQSAKLKWLIEQGYEIEHLRIPECLSHLLKVHRKYDRLRRNKVLRLLKKIFKNGEQ